MTAGSSGQWRSSDDVAHRLAAAERLRRSANEIARAVGEAAVDTGGEVRAVVAGVVHAVAAALVRGHGRGAAEGSFALRLAEQAVVDGATLDGVRRVMHDAVTECRNLLLGLRGEASTAEPEAMVAPSEVARIIADAEFALLAAFDGVAAPEPGVARLARMRDAFLRRVLTQPVADTGAAANRARQLGLHLMPPVAVVLLQLDPALPMETERDAGGLAPTAPDVLDVRAAAALRRLPGDVYGPIVFDTDPLVPEFAVLVSSHGVGGAADRLDAALEDACGEEGLLAARVEAPGVADLHVARLRLEMLAPILARVARFHGRVVTWHAAWPYVAVQQIEEEEARDIQREELGPLMVEKRGAAARVETWQLLVRRQLTAAEAAGVLNVAESTVRERRKEIERLLRCRIEDGLFQAQVASYLFDLWRDEMPGPGDPWWGGAEG